MDGSEGARRLEGVVREAMAARGIANAEALATAVGVHPTTVYAIFAGRQRPTSTTMAKMAKATGVPLRELWRAYEGEPEPDSVTADGLADVAAALRELAAAIRLSRGDSEQRRDGRGGRD